MGEKKKERKKNHMCVFAQQPHLPSTSTTIVITPVELLNQRVVKENKTVWKI